MVAHMNTRIILAVIVALTTGTAIAVQSTLSGRVGSFIGPIRTGMLVNMSGGLIALVAMILSWTLSRLGTSAPGSLNLTGNTVSATELLLLILFAGFIGILIIAGVSYSVQRVGVTAGLSAVILAQLLVGLFIDRAGGAGGLAVAIDLRRLAGIAAMAVGVWLLLPQRG